MIVGKNMTNFKAVRLCVIVALVVSAFFDFGSLLLNYKYLAFETNPLFLVSGSIVLVLLLKFVVIGILCYGVWFGPVVDWIQYALVLTAIYCTVGQVYGGYSNILVGMAHPGPEQVLPRQEAIHSYINLVVWYQIIPLIIATFAFKLHKWGGYDRVNYPASEMRGL